MPFRDVAKQSCSRFFCKRQWLSQKGYAIFDSVFPVHRSKVYLCTSFIDKRIGSDCCFINLNKHFFSSLFQMIHQAILIQSYLLVLSDFTFHLHVPY